MSATPIKDAASAAIQARIPVLITGPPGTGKTSFIKALGADLGVPTVTIISSIREPSDFSGLPVVSDDGVRMAEPKWARDLATAPSNGVDLSGILFLDEITTVSPTTQAALLRVINEGVVGECELPETVARCAAANPPEMAAGGWNLTPPLANRFIHLEWPNNPLEWADAAVAGWKVTPSEVRVPGTWKDIVPAKLSLVSAYIRNRTDKLLVYPTNDAAKQGGAWSSPRSWEMAAQALAVIESCGNMSDDSQVYLLAGAIGKEHGIEFLTWTRELDLPDPEDLLEKPKSFKLPDRPDKIYAVLSSVVTAVLNDLTQERWEQGWKVCSEAASQGSADIAAFAAKAFIKNGDGLDYKPILTILKPFTEIMKGSGLMIGSQSSR